MSTMRGLDFYFDFMSPYGYLAHTQLLQIAARHGLEIAYRPVDLASIKLAVGNTGPSTREMPIKHRHLRVDLQRWAQLYAVPLRPPAGYGSIRVNCGALLAIDRGVAGKYAERAWQEIWGEGSDMNDDAVLTRLATAMGWDAQEFLGFVSGGSARDRLARETAAATERGVFGVPTMILGDEMWWGNDRLQFLEARLEESER